MAVDPIPTVRDEMIAIINAAGPWPQDVADAILAAGFTRECRRCSGTGEIEVEDAGFASHLGEQRTHAAPCPDCTKPDVAATTVLPSEVVDAMVVYHAACRARGLSADSHQEPMRVVLERMLAKRAAT